MLEDPLLIVQKKAPARPKAVHESAVRVFIKFAKLFQTTVSRELGCCWLFEPPSTHRESFYRVDAIV